MWPIQFAFRLRISYRIFLSSLNQKADLYVLPVRRRHWFNCKDRTPVTKKIMTTLHNLHRSGKHMCRTCLTLYMIIRQPYIFQIMHCEKIVHLGECGITVYQLVYIFSLYVAVIV
jgi:hypothetical protein